MLGMPFSSNNRILFDYTDKTTELCLTNITAMAEKGEIVVYQPDEITL